MYNHLFVCRDYASDERVVCYTHNCNGFELFENKIDIFALCLENKYRTEFRAGAVFFLLYPVSPVFFVSYEYVSR